MSTEAASRWGKDVGSEVVADTLSELDDLLAMLETWNAPVYCLTDMWIPGHLHLWVKECRDILSEGTQPSNCAPNSDSSDPET